MSEVTLYGVRHTLTIFPTRLSGRCTMQYIFAHNAIRAKMGFNMVC